MNLGGLDRDDDTYIARAGISYLPNKFITVSANYRYFANSSNVAYADLQPTLGRYNICCKILIIYCSWESSHQNGASFFYKPKLPADEMKKALIYLMYFTIAANARCKASPYCIYCRQ